MTGTILLVEDEENDAFFMQWAMNSAGVVNPIHLVSDGREAIDYFRGTGRFTDRKEFPLPCLVLLDLKLPYVMGLDVLKWVRQQPGVAAIVLILSSSGAETDVVAAYRLRANGYLVKPSSPNKLVEMAKAIKNLWLTGSSVTTGVGDLNNTAGHTPNCSVSDSLSGQWSSANVARAS